MIYTFKQQHWKVLFFLTHFTISGYENVRFVQRDGRQKVMVSYKFYPLGCLPGLKNYMLSDIHRQLFAFKGSKFFLLMCSHVSIPLVKVAAFSCRFRHGCLCQWPSLLSSHSWGWWYLCQTQWTTTIPWPFNLLLLPTRLTCTWLSDCQRLIQCWTCRDCLDDVFVGNFLFVFLRAMPWSLASRSRWSLVSQGPSRVPWKNSRYAKQILESYLTWFPHIQVLSLDTLTFWGAVVWF